MPNLDLYSDNNDISFHDSCLPVGYALFRHRRGRKTETSSDTSQESLLAFQAFLRRFP